MYIPIPVHIEELIHRTVGWESQMVIPSQPHLGSMPENFLRNPHLPHLPTKKNYCILDLHNLDQDWPRSFLLGFTLFVTDWLGDQTFIVLNSTAPFCHSFTRKQTLLSRRSDFVIMECILLVRFGTTDTESKLFSPLDR